MASIISELEAEPLDTRLALGITGGVIVAVLGFVALGAWLHVAPLYAGFLFLWLWSALDEMNFKALPAAVLGALVGTGMSYLLQLGTSSASVPLIVMALGLMVVALFLVVAKRMAIACNSSTMLFITVLNAPVVQQNEDFRAVFVAIMLGVVWFGAIAWAIGRLVAAQAKPA
jgi:hypothetical protein